MIEVILLERIQRLGTIGQVVKVRPGFARNFLLPQNKALRATKSNLEVFAQQKADLEAKNEAARVQAEALAGTMKRVTLTVIRQASETGYLFGSVTARDVAEAAVEAKENILRNQVQIDAPIKTIGLFPVKVRLHAEVSVNITVNVARSVEEAVIQLEKGVAAIKMAEDKANVIAAMGAPAEDDAGAKAPKGKKAKPAKAEAVDADDADTDGEEKPAKKTKTKKVKE